MTQVNLLASLPKAKRNIEKRAAAKDPAVIAEAKKFDQMYWDGPREYGYGGYKYDGRWRTVAKDIIVHFNLRPGMRVLDVGCGKGFLVKDLMLECPGLEVFGLDISYYALMHSPPETYGRLHLGTADDLPFPDNAFDCVLSINALHNLPRSRLIMALKEIQRLSPQKSFIQVDAYLTQEQKELFESWVLTAEFHDFPQGWYDVFAEAGYTGDWDWTIVE